LKSFKSLGWWVKGGGLGVLCIWVNSNEQSKTVGVLSNWKATIDFFWSRGSIECNA